MQVSRNRLPLKSNNKIYLDKNKVRNYKQAKNKLNSHHNYSAEMDNKRDLAYGNLLSQLSVIGNNPKNLYIFLTNELKDGTQYSGNCHQICAVAYRFLMINKAIIR